MRVRFPNGAPIDCRNSSKAEHATDNRAVKVRFFLSAPFIRGYCDAALRPPSPIARAIRRSHWLTRLFEGTATLRCGHPRDSSRTTALTVRSLVLFWVTGRDG